MADKKSKKYDLEGARKSQIPDEESLSYLAGVHKYDLEAAREAGIPDEESLTYLANMEPPKAEVYEKESPEFFGGIGASAGAIGAGGDIVFSKGRQLFREGEKIFGVDDPNVKVKPRQFATPSQVAERAINIRSPQAGAGAPGAVENYGRSQFVSPEGKGLYYGAGDTGDYAGARKAAERAIQTEQMFPEMKVLQGKTPLAVPQDVASQVEAQRAEEARIRDAQNQREVNRMAQIRAERLNERTRLKNLANRGKMLAGSQTVATKVGAPIIGGYELGAQGAQAYNRLTREDLQASDVAAGATNVAGAALGGASMLPGGKFRLPKALGSVGLNYLSDLFDTRNPRKSVLEESPPPGMAAGGLAMMAAGGKLGKAAEVAKKAANKVMSGGEQTVTNPIRNAFPGIYKRPDIIAQEAAARVAPESPALKQLFGVTRDDLYEMGKGRVGNLPGTLPGMAANPKGSAAATNVMNPRNEQRLLDVLSEAEKYPELVKGMDPWYIMDPVYKRMEELMGPEKAREAYQRFNTLTGMASPGSDVLTEMNRGTAANYLAQQGRFDDFLKYAGKPAAARGADFPEDLRAVMGHPYHMTAQGTPMKKYLESGEIQMKSPKVPAYIQASSVPEVGFQTNLPVGDAHWSRAVGLADTRGGQSFGASVSNPEMAQLAPWWRDKIAGEIGIESVPAQARAWGAFSPQTGVESPIGAPKIELLSMKIMEAAKRLNITPEEARDMILKGEAYAGKKEGGAVEQFAKGGSTTPAWQRKEGKNPEGGLNALGRASYNRETGGNLKAPQPEGGSRKKSFCARMGGMKKKLTSSKTANDPDSRINKALRKWKC